MLDFLSFPFTFSIAAITLGSLAFTSALFSASLARWCFPDVDFSTLTAGGSWPSTPLLATLTTLATFQAHCFLDFVAYCCHLVPCVVDVRLYDEVNWPFSHRIHWAQYCICATTTSLHKRTHVQSWMTFKNTEISAQPEFLKPIYLWVHRVIALI